MASTAKRFGVMLDMSRNAVMRPTELKKFAKLLRSFGYNMIQLYTEDTYEVDGEPYFGYMRGRYTKEELRDIVEYCDSIGIEVIPCIQTLAHLNQIFRYDKYKRIRDTSDILLVGDERTYEFIENMFSTLRQVFKTDRIHIGMDEAHMLGLGSYLDKHGYRNRFDILSEHLTRVIEIAKKYGFTPIMWSDMFFRLANHGVYSTLDDTINDEIISKCPEGVELVYWDYYHNTRDYYDNMIRQHKKFGRDCWFAGGAWCWNGFAPFNKWSLESMSVAMQSCAEQGIENIFFTMWGDNGKECSFYSLLPSLFAFCRMYEGITDEAEIKRLFKEATGEDYDAMLALDLPNRVSPDNSTLSNVSKVMLYNDPFIGTFDNAVNADAPKDFAAHAELLSEYAKSSAFRYIFESEAALCRLLAVKYDLGVRTRKAYASREKEAILAMVAEYARTAELLEDFYAKFRELWMRENKPFGFEVQELRIGGLLMRLRSSGERLAAFAKGEIDVIEELEEPILDYMREGSCGKMPRLNNWATIASPSVI